MAMNKTEKAELDSIKLECILAKALHMTEPVLPDIPPPKNHEPLTVGWVFNEHNMAVYTACSSSIGHGIGDTDKTTSHRPLSLYSTQELAYRGLRAVLERKFAGSLLKIDKQISKLCQK